MAKSNKSRSAEGNASNKSAEHGAQSRSLSILRGGERFELERSPDLFAIKRRPSGTRGTLATARKHAGLFQGLEFQEGESGRGIEVYRISAGSRDAAMERLRSEGVDGEWCAHVYHMPGRPDGHMIPTDVIYVEVDPGADPREVNRLIAEHHLEVMPADESDSHKFALRLTSKSRENPIKIANALNESQAISLAEPDFAMKVRFHAYRPADALFPQQWHLENRGGVGLTAGADVRAPDAWELSRGARAIRVCVMDDGVQLDHPDFASPGKIVAPRDFDQNDQDPSPGSGDNHGTACAGVAVADENGDGVVGIAPGCALMPYRTSGFITDQSIADLFDSARADGADVISCSWGVNAEFFTLSTRMKNAIHRTASEGRGGRGCVIVFASGNEDSPVDGVKDGQPVRSGFAIHPDVIAVNASNSHDVRSHYSNYGPKTWIAAPSSGAGGRGIVTTDRTGGAGYQSGDYTTVNGFGGTSSACPLVAGVCALLLSIDPELTREEVKDLLRRTADKIDPAGGNYNAAGHSDFYGYGRVNAFKAATEARNRRAPTPARRITLERAPMLAIPDFQPAGVTDTIQVPDAARVLGVAVSLEIAHTYRGDLRVELVGPDGTTVVLHERQGGGSDDLLTSYTVASLPALAAFTNASAHGAWSLRISDHARRDEGVLRRWTLTLELASASPRTEWEAHPGTHIPDDAPAGITSEIEVTESGPLSDIAVSLDITHAWRGDLRVVLETPHGIHVQLHERSGDSADDLTRTYGPADTPALLALVQAAQDIHGTWRLRVSDHAARDIGKLNAWKLTLLAGSGTLQPQGRLLAAARRARGGRVFVRR